MIWIWIVFPHIGGRKSRAQTPSAFLGARRPRHHSLLFNLFRQRAMTRLKVKPLAANRSNIVLTAVCWVKSLPGYEKKSTNTNRVEPEERPKLRIPALRSRLLTDSTLRKTWSMIKKMMRSILASWSKSSKTSCLPDHRLRPLRDDLQRYCGEDLLPVCYTELQALL